MGVSDLCILHLTDLTYPLEHMTLISPEYAGTKVMLRTEVRGFESTIISKWVNGNHQLPSKRWHLPSTFIVLLSKLRRSRQFQTYPKSLTESKSKKVINKTGLKILTYFGKTSNYNSPDDLAIINLSDKQEMKLQIHVCNESFGLGKILLASMSYLINGSPHSVLKNHS